jgi:hypothetical protein
VARRGKIGWAWNAGQDQTHGFRYPFVMAVELEAGSLKVVAEPIIWNSAYAYQYAAVAPDADGTLGGVVNAGGGTRYLSCAAIVGRQGGGWDAALLDSSSTDPAEPRAGDYPGVSSGSDTNSWSGTCSTLKGGAGRDHENVEYFSFGRGG